MSDTSSTRRPARVHVVFAPHWVNAWLVRPLARPFLRVDDDEHPASWGDDLVVQLPEGRHVLESFIRYRGSSVDMGTGRVPVDLGPDEDVHLRVHNGWTNGAAFVPTLRREP